MIGIRKEAFRDFRSSLSQIPKQQMILFTVIALLLLMCVGVWASDPVEATYQSVAGGYLVSFVLHNTFTSGMWYWFVLTGDATSPAAPLGWRTRQDYRSVGWDNQMNHVYDIHPGTSLGGFSYIASSPPGALTWYIGVPIAQSGSVTPIFIPEPSSLLALCAGIGTMGALIRRRR